MGRRGDGAGDERTAERATSGQRGGSGAAAGRQRRSEQRDQQSNLSPLLPLPTKLWATSKTNSRTALGSGYLTHQLRKLVAELRVETKLLHRGIG